MPLYPDYICFYKLEASSTSTMVKSTFLSRRLSKPKLSSSTSKSVSTSTQRAAVKVDPVEESRDDPGLLEAFFNPSSWLPTAETLGLGEEDALSSFDDIQSIIDAHVDEETRARCLSEKSTISAMKSIGSNQNVKGSHSTLANEIKKLGKLERKKEKAEKLILRCEQEISLAEQEQKKTRERIKALSYKFELHGMMDGRTSPQDNEYWTKW